MFKPVFQLPPLACDAHCHVFGPGAIFPYADTRKYTPTDAPKAQLFSLHEFLGFDRAVLVQASCHGTDNRAMTDMLRDANGRYRGVAIVDETFTQTDLRELHDAGVRGVRFNFLPRLVDSKSHDHYLKIANLIAELNWHIVVYFESENLRNLVELFETLPCPIVIDHMGRPDVSLPVQHENFQLICSLLANNSKHHNHKNYIKVSCIERISKLGAPYEDAIPFAKYLIDHFPDQVLWGTDWPHPNLDISPDDSQLVDSIPRMASTPTLQKKLLVDNPHRLYGFDN